MPAVYKRCVRHVAASYRRKGKSAKRAERIAHATCTARNVGNIKAVRKREAAGRRRRKSAARRRRRR